MQFQKRRNEGGNTFIEFGIVCVFLIPILLGTVNVGLMLSRGIQVTQLSRDAGHLYARLVDFSEPGNQDLLVRLARGLGMTRDAGYGRITLSQVMYVGQQECAAGGLSLAQCTNYQHPVILQRLVIGNDSLQESVLGTPPLGLIQNDGTVFGYLQTAEARADNFDNILALQPGEFAYVSEAFFDVPTLAFPGFFEDSAAYARTIF